MGIKGSSTRQIFLQRRACASVENLLYEREQGLQDRGEHPEHRTHQIGRRRTRCASKDASHAYHPRGTPTNASNSGAPSRSTAPSATNWPKAAIRLYTGEAANYRATQNIDDAIAALKAGGHGAWRGHAKGHCRFRS